MNPFTALKNLSPFHFTFLFFSFFPLILSTLHFTLLCYSPLQLASLHFTSLHVLLFIAFTSPTVLHFPNPRFDYQGLWDNIPQLAEEIMADLWRDFWIRETGTSQQVAQFHERLMMMMMMMMHEKDAVQLGTFGNKWKFFLGPCSFEWKWSKFYIDSLFFFTVNAFHTN
jgi:hypothetical protein